MKYGSLFKNRDRYINAKRVYLYFHLNNNKMMFTFINIQY